MRSPEFNRKFVPSDVVKIAEFRRYGRAARLIEQMEEQGIIGQADGSRPREVLVNSVDDVFGGGAVPVGDDIEPIEDDREAFLNR